MTGISSLAASALSRRGFLKTTAAAGLAAAARTVWAADAPIPASDRIGVGLIGLGKLGFHSHLNGFLGDSRVHVAAVCDVERQRLGQAKARVEERYAERFKKGSYKGCAAYVDFRELLARPDIDAVVISSPEHWHAIHAAEACRAGKHVYCEKPMAYGIAEARAVVNAAERYGRVFQTGTQQRSERMFRFACELVRSGRIGKVHTMHVNVGGPSVECYLPAEPTPKSMEWDLWLGPAPWRPYHSALQPLHLENYGPWRRYRDYGGGSMTDIGSHHFDIAQWGLGMDGTGPVEVCPPDGKERRRLTFRYANGVTMFHGGGMSGCAVEFIGSEGRVAVNRGQLLKTEPESLAREPIGPGEVHLYESPSHRGNWLEGIRTGRPTICPAEVGCRSVTVCHLANLAYRLKRPLKWDPERERFVGDAEANRLLMRPMRSPWRV